MTSIFFDPGRDSFLGVLTSHKGLKSNMISGFYAGVTFLLDGSTTNQCNSCVGDGDKDFGPLVVIVFAPVLASFNLLGG